MYYETGVEAENNLEDEEQAAWVQKNLNSSRNSFPQQSDSTSYHAPVIYAQDAKDKDSRCVVHIDVDYFYAQVEVLLDPSLKDKPGQSTTTMWSSNMTLFRSRRTTKELGYHEQLCCEKARIDQGYRRCRSQASMSRPDFKKWREFGSV